MANGYGCAAGALNNKLYVIGGAAAPQTQLTIYDIATNTWSTGTPAPSGVFLSGYQTVGNYLYIVGGFTGAVGANSTATMRLDMSTGTWSSGPAFTPQRADFGLASFGTKLYAIGGDLNGGAYFDSTDARQRAEHGDLAGRKLGRLTAQPARAGAAGEPGRLQLDRPRRRRDLVDGRDQRGHVPVPERSPLPRGDRRATATAASATATTSATTAAATTATATATATATSAATSAATATATSATATTTSATTTTTTATSATTATTATTAATATTASATATATSTSATSGPLPRAAGDRTEARCREAADPQGQLPSRPRTPRSHQASAARPRHRSEPEAGRRQARRLPGQPAGRPRLGE